MWPYRRNRSTFMTIDETRAWIDATVTDLDRNNRPQDAFDTREARLAMNMLPDGVTLIEAVRFYMRHHAKAAEVTLADAVSMLVDEKKAAGMRQKSLSTLRNNLERLAKKMGKKYVADIDAQMLVDWLDKHHYKGVTRDNYRRSFRNLFRWCKRRGYTLNDPTESITVPMVDQKLPVIFMPEQVQSVMKTAEEFTPELVPYLALGLFAGIRPNEHALEWAAIGDQIHVGPKVAKIRQQRFVSITPNLKEWLEKYQGKGRVVPFSAKKKAQIKAKLRTKLELDRWPHDVMRHSFASYHLALTQDAPKTSHELGHTSPEMLYRHDRNLVTEAQAKAYFAIKP